MTNFKMTDWMAKDANITFEQWLSDPLFGFVWLRYSQLATTFKKERDIEATLNLGLTIIPLRTYWCHHRSYVMFHALGNGQINQPFLVHSIYSDPRALEFLSQYTLVTVADAAYELVDVLKEMEVHSEINLFICQYLVDLYCDARIVNIEYSRQAGTVKILLVTPASYVEMDIDVAIINTVLNYEDYFDLNKDGTKLIYGRERIPHRAVGHRYPTYHVAE